MVTLRIQLQRSDVTGDSFQTYLALNSLITFQGKLCVAFQTTIERLQVFILWTQSGF